jgi:predicted 3-demethylubiquinone-9 3-methyltransferase (glyoxalase superfamily)
MAKLVLPFLMFTGEAEEAMAFYTSLFDDAEILDIARVGPEGPGAEGTVHRATFSLAGQEFLCTDSPPVHDFSFTPSFSIWIETDSEDEIERLFRALANGGTQLMPLDDYGFSRRFGWLNDRYGVGGVAGGNPGRSGTLRAPHGGGGAPILISSSPMASGMSTCQRARSSVARVSRSSDVVLPWAWNRKTHTSPTS